MCNESSSHRAGNTPCERLSATNESNEAKNVSVLKIFPDRMLPITRFASLQFVENKKRRLLKSTCARLLRPNIVSFDRQRGW